jgi:hypothetical protein
MNKNKIDSSEPKQKDHQFSLENVFNFVFA